MHDNPRTTQATSEVPLQIDIMNVTDVDMKLSFKADAVSRPRVTNQVDFVCNGGCQEEKG